MLIVMIQRMPDAILVGAIFSLTEKQCVHGELI
jgi:hypothetical protein